jgi:predicted neutral ceramidase superfamily lipid hydrolase
MVRVNQESNYNATTPFLPLQYHSDNSSYSFRQLAILTSTLHYEIKDTYSTVLVTTPQGFRAFQLTHTHTHTHTYTIAKTTNQ